MVVRWSESYVFLLCATHLDFKLFRKGRRRYSFEYISTEARRVTQFPVIHFFFCEEYPSARFLGRNIDLSSKRTNSCGYMSLFQDQRILQVDFLIGHRRSERTAVQSMCCEAWRYATQRSTLLDSLQGRGH